MTKPIKSIWLDMDGTIADLYNFSDWLQYLEQENPLPYWKAQPLVNMQVLARYLNRLTANGYTINIVSWLPKNSTPTYNQAVIQAKRAWLHKHLKSVHFTDIDIIPYGTRKKAGRAGLLFDDEPRNLKAWGAGAYNANELLTVLKELTTKEVNQCYTN